MSTTTRRVAGAAAFAFPVALAPFANAGVAGAATLDIPEMPESVTNAVKNTMPTNPLPSPVVPVADALPGNILRRDDVVTSTAHDDVVATTVSAPPAPPRITVDDLNAAQAKTLAGHVTSGNFEAAGRMLQGTDIGTSLSSALPTAEDFDKVFHGEFAPFGYQDADWEKGIEGLTQWQNSMIAEPVATIQRTVAEAGGIGALVTNPVDAIKRAATSIAGPQFADDLVKVGLDVYLPVLTKDLPLATLAGLATLLLTPLLPALAGALAGGSLSGLAGSALGLAIAATLTYGAWLAIGIPAMTVIGLVLGAVVAIAILAIGLILTPFMLFSPLPFFFSFGAAAIALLFMPILAMVIYTGLTWWIPTLAFAILAPLLMGTGGLLGSIPGALMGGSLGFLAGALAAVPLASLVFALVGNKSFNDRLNEPENREALGRLVEAWNRAWNETELGRIFDRINRAFWDSAIGRAIKPFLDAWGALWANINWQTIINGATAGGLRGILDGLREGFPNGALTGALLGLPILLTTLAATLVPPAAIGFMAVVFATVLGSLPILAIAVPLWLLSVPVAIVGFLMNGAGLLLTLTIIGAPIGIPLFGMGWGIAGFAAGYAGVVATITALLIGGLFLLNLGIVGIPTFLLTAPLFVFPALAVQGPLYLTFILAMGALYGLVGAIYGAGSGGIKGALAALPFALDWRGAIEKFQFQPPAADVTVTPPQGAAPVVPTGANPADTVTTDVTRLLAVA